MNLQHIKSACTLSIVSVALTGCVAGVFDEEKFESKNQSVVIQGITGEPNQQVEVNCTNGDYSERIASFLSSAVPSTNAEGNTGYTFKRTIRVPEDCWATDGGVVNAEPTPGQTHDYHSQLTVDVEGFQAWSWTREEFEDCIIPNIHSFVTMLRDCDYVSEIDIHAARWLPFTMSQAAMTPYFDGTNLLSTDPTQQKPTRDNWLNANDLEEVAFWFGTDFYPGNAGSMLWETNLIKSKDGKSAIIAFAGSEPGEWQNGQANVPDASDWYFDTWVDLMPANESVYKTNNGAMENLCQEYNCNIHSGFLAYVSHFWQSAKATDGLLNELRALKAQGVSRVYFTGHSLGGALAVVASAYYQAERNAEIQDGINTLPSITKVYTFGSPMVGDLGFASMYDSIGLGIRTEFYAAEGDPGAIFPRYLHPCDELEWVSSQTVCWGLAEGDNSKKSWNDNKRLYVGVGKQIIVTRNLDNSVSTTEGNFENWPNGYDTGAHALTNYMQLLSDCDTNGPCNSIE